MTLRRKVGLVISLVAFAISIHTLPPLVTWFSSQFSLAPQLFGVVFLLQSGTFTLFAMGIGNLHKRRDLPLIRIAIIALFVASTVLFFIGFTPSFFLLILMMMVIGGGGGLVESVGTTLLSEDSKSQKLLHLSQTFFAVGAFTAPLIVGLFLKAGLKVPQIGMAVGGFALVIAVVVLILVTDKTGAKASAVVEEETTVQQNGGSKGFIWLFLTIVTYVLLENSLASWLPVFLESTFSFNPANASLTLTCFWVGLAATRLIFVFLKRYSTRKSILGYVLFLFAGSLLFVFLPSTAPMWLVMGVVALIGLGCGPIWVLIIENCREIYSDSHLVMYLVGGGALGGLIGPLLTSGLFTLTSIAALGYIQIVYGVLLTILTLVALKSTKPSTLHLQRG